MHGSALDDIIRKYDIIRRQSIIQYSDILLSVIAASYFPLRKLTLPPREDYPRLGGTAVQYVIHYFYI